MLDDCVYLEREREREKESERKRARESEKGGKREKRVCVNHAKTIY